MGRRGSGGGARLPHAGARQDANSSIAGIGGKGMQDAHPVAVIVKGGESDPADSAIVYAIETKDGVKGILIDSYGAYRSDKISKFITEVENITKRDNHSKTEVEKVKE